MGFHRDTEFGVEGNHLVQRRTGHFLGKHEHLMRIFPVKQSAWWLASGGGHRPTSVNPLSILASASIVGIYACLDFEHVTALSFSRFQFTLLSHSESVSVWSGGMRISREEAVEMYAR